MTGAAGPFIVRLQRPCEACGQELEYVDGENPHWRGHGDSEDAPGWEPGPDPYCVREDEPDGGAPPLSVKAVADLDTATNAGMHLILDASDGEWGPGKVGAAVYKVLETPAEGGTVPLPDGSEIHVEATTYEALAEAAGYELHTFTGSADEAHAAALRVWNSRFGASQEKERSGDGDRA